MAQFEGNTPAQQNRPVRATSRFLTRALLTGVAAATLMSGMLNTAALAGENARIKEISFTIEPSNFPSTIEVTSSNGAKWDTIEPGSVMFRAHAKVDTRLPGYVADVGMFLGQCDNHQCGNGYPLLTYDQPMTRDYIREGNVTFSTTKIPVSKPGIAVVPYGDQILSACNAHLQQDGATKSHSFIKSMTVSFSVNTQKGVTIPPAEVMPEAGPIYAGGEVTRQGSFNVNVMCKPFRKTSNDIVAKQPATLEVGSIDLFRTTYSHATSQPNPGTVCKKARWLVRLNTNKAGPVKFKLWIKNGAAPMTSKVIDAFAQFDGPGKFKAEYAEWTEVTKTSVVQAMAEDMTNPIGQSTGWKDITLHCTGAGGGGLAGTPGNANPDNGTLPNTLKITGELSLADKAGAPKDKPRLGQVVFKIWASKPGNTSYKLTCSGGRNWEGTLPTFKIADHKYQAVGAQNFQIDKTEQIGCALRSTSLSKNDVIAVDTQMFELVKRNADLGGPDTLVGLTKPQTSELKHPARPGIKIAPTPKISCAGGKVSNNTCFCPGGTTKVHAGLNAYRCLKRTVQPQRLAPPAARKPVPRETHRLRHRLQSADAGNR